MLYIVAIGYIKTYLDGKTRKPPLFFHLQGFSVDVVFVKS